MAIEVEQKFPVTDPAALRARLAELGARQQHEIEQVDIYFAHPGRDFAQTDEALRLRCVGVDNYITYKGPKLDARTKTRREIEIPLPPGKSTAQDAQNLVEALGFRSVREVRKTRTELTLTWQEHEVTVCLDRVAGLGDFVELEIVTPQAGMAAAVETIGRLAARLQLSGSERRSYLELLLAGETRQQSATEEKRP